MKRDQTLERNWRGGLGSVEPHFDDERTILSAQPVIPLEKVESVKTWRVWMFVAAFIVASLLGSAAALALIKIRQPAAVEVATELQTVEPQTTEQPVAQVPDDTAESTVTESAPSADSTEEAQNHEASVAEAPKPARPANRRTEAPAPVRVTIRTNKTTARDDDADEPRLLDQWQERRQRRVSRSKDPGDQHHSSDLFRIRDIFEGPRRGRRTRN